VPSKNDSLHPPHHCAVSSELFPFAAHPDYQYSLEYAAEELKLAGETARRLGVRLTSHPAQFCNLCS
jgi:UV DNA damage endonuclease